MLKACKMLKAWKESAGPISAFSSLLTIDARITKPAENWALPKCMINPTIMQ
jgi:hypothetical protein